MLFRRHCTEFFPVQCCPKSIQITLNRILSCAMFSEASWATLHKVLPVQCCPKSIKTTLNIIFFAQCCPEPLVQHCTKRLSVQCCPKGIQTTLKRIFSYDTSILALHRVFTYAVLCWLVRLNSGREASHQPAVMGISHTCLLCLPSR